MKILEKINMLQPAQETRKKLIEEMLPDVYPEGDEEDE